MMHLIAAVARDNGLGYQNRLLFSIPQDLHRFKELTTGKTVVMGRTTLESLPNGKPLPNRRNIVLTHNASYLCDGAESVHSVDELFQRLSPTEEVWVMGGASVYALLMPYCQDAYLTEVDAIRPADCYFPALGAEWNCADVGEWQTFNGIKYRFCRWIQEKSH